MRFSPQFLEDIKSRVSVSSIVSPHVKLKKTGREYQGLSPFNKEKSPSFTVNDQKGFYHCFSSGKHGNIFDFLKEVEGLSFPDAVEKCAGLAGLSMPVYSPEQRVKDEQRASLYDVCEHANQFFESQLQTSLGAKARGYLVTRGVSTKTQLKFRLGYSPNERFALRDYLLSKNISKEQMIEAGLLIHGEDIAVPYDRFRDRLMFPIKDMKGNIIGFGGRALEKDVPAKYLNSPETEIFHKGNNLYHGNIARQAAHKANRLIAVEGYMDVIALSQSGIDESVAPLGTALTIDQLYLLWSMNDAPILLFDGDKAGQKAAFRAADLALEALKPGKTLKFVTLPNNQDPDDIIKTQGRDALESLLAKASPLADKIWERETAYSVFETPEQKAQLEIRLKQIANTIQDENLKRHYRDDLLKRFNESFFNARFTPKSTYSKPFKSQKAQSGLSLNQRNAMEISLPKREAEILYCLFTHVNLRQTHFEQLTTLDLTSHEAKQLLQNILDFEAGLIDGKSFEATRNDFLSNLSLPIPASLGEKATENQIKIAFFQLLTLQNKQQALNRELIAAQEALALDLTEENFAWLKDVKSRMHNIEGTEALIES